MFTIIQKVDNWIEIELTDNYVHRIKAFECFNQLI